MSFKVSKCFSSDKNKFLSISLPVVRDRKNVGLCLEFALFGSYWNIQMIIVQTRA